MSKVGQSLLRGAEEALLYARGSSIKGIKKHIVKVPVKIDVKAIREQLHMDRTTFAESFGFSLRTLEKWEQGVRQPETPTRAYLKVIAYDATAVAKALQQM